MSKKIKLVMSGSGTRYPCFVGAILRLVEEGYEITEVCGTSGGAIVAAGLASGFKPNEEIVSMMKKTLPAKNGLIDFSLMSLLFKWGLIKGDKIEGIFKKHLVKNFSDTIIPCHIVTTNLERKAARVFSTVSDPDMSLAKAVRASISIPGVFTPIRIDDELYVDGGMTANYLLDIFGTGEDVIGLRFGSASTHTEYSKATKVKKIKSVADYISANIDSMLESTTREHIEDAMFARTIMLETTHGGLNFGMTDADCDSMISEGWKSTDEWIKKQN